LWEMEGEGSISVEYSKTKATINVAFIQNIH
jgi:hypothetical protein